MKVIDRSMMPDGTQIQLEDWREHNTEAYPDLYGYTIGAYPIAKNSSYWVRGGRTFRLGISTNKFMNYLNDDVLADYETLKSGEKSLEDMAKHFWNGEKDMWYLGMDVKLPAGIYMGTV